MGYLKKLPGDPLYPGPLPSNRMLAFQEAVQRARCSFDLGHVLQGSEDYVKETGTCVACGAKIQLAPWIRSTAQDRRIEKRDQAALRAAGRR